MSSIPLVDVVSLSKQKCQHPIIGKLAYATDENFIGRVINGYSPDATDVCLLTPKAAHALCQAQNELNEKHQLGLLIYDAYRPHRAVKDFAQWIQQPPTAETISYSNF